MNSLDKEDYILFVNQNKDKIPIYFHPEWLNAVCGNFWIALVYKNNANRKGKKRVEILIKFRPNI